MVNVHGSSNVDIELLRLSVLPSTHAENYQQMWAYGNHFRVEHAEDGRGFVTQDFGIASIFGAEEGRSAGVHMVGVLKEIIVVRYSAQRRVVFRGSWIRNEHGPRVSTKVDQYGFTIVRFNDRVARNREPYVLPATVRQVRSFADIICHDSLQCPYVFPCVYLKVGAKICSGASGDGSHHLGGNT